MTQITFSIDAQPTGAYAVVAGCKYFLIADPFEGQAFTNFASACDALSVHVAECGVCARPQVPNGFVKPVYDIGAEFDVVLDGTVAVEVLRRLGVGTERFDDAWSLDASFLRALLAHARADAGPVGTLLDDLDALAVQAATRGRLVTCA